MTEDISRLDQQISFIKEIDKLKTISRQTLLMDGSRAENDAEHSWHLCMMALVLKEYAADDVDIFKVMVMVALHDVVEIYAGDTFCYDDEGRKDKLERERSAADRIFGLLPAEQAEEFRAYWEEFEERISSEARFAASLDRLQPVLHNYATEGAAWKRHGVTRAMVEEKNAHIQEGSETLWKLFCRIVDDSVRKGYLPEEA